MNILGKKLKSKTTSKDTEVCCGDAKEAYVPVKYRVSAVLADKLFNKELNKWLFVNPYNEKDEIIIVNNQEVEFDVQDSFWRVTEKFNAGVFTEITIKRIN